MPIADIVRQISIFLSLPAALVAAAAAAVIVIVRDWRLILLAYGLLSAMLALLFSQAIPTEWALLQAIVGGLVAVMLYLSGRQLRGLQVAGLGHNMRWPYLASLTSFRFLAVVLAAVAFLLVRERVVFPVVTPLFRDTILWLGLMGVLGLALHEEPMHAGLALLVVLGGFLLLFNHLVQQRLFVGLLQGWQLLLGLAISYLTVSHGLAVVEPASEPTRWWQQR